MKRTRNISPTVIKRDLSPLNKDVKSPMTNEKLTTSSFTSESIQDDYIFGISSNQKAE